MRVDETMKFPNFLLDIRDKHKMKKMRSLYRNELWKLSSRA